MLICCLLAQVSSRNISAQHGNQDVMQGGDEETQHTQVIPVPQSSRYRSEESTMPSIRDIADENEMRGLMPFPDFSNSSVVPGQVSRMAQRHASSGTTFNFVLQQNCEYEIKSLSLK